MVRVMDLVDEVVVTDDASPDETVEVARKLGLRTLVHQKNLGYGGNQKTCYTEALRLGADVTVMLHPDYQYTPRLIPAMIGMMTDGPFDVVLGSRVLGGRALSGGMPRYKYLANRALTAVENLLLAAKLSAREVAILRAFARYLRQVGIPFSQTYMEDTLVAHAKIARKLIELFGALLGPASRGDASARAAATETEIGALLEDRKSTRLNSSHMSESRMPSSA